MVKQDHNHNHGDSVGIFFKFLCHGHLFLTGLFVYETVAMIIDYGEKLFIVFQINLTKFVDRFDR